MNRIEFILITAIILFLAFAMGWFAHWVIHRFTRVTKADLGELERMAQKPAIRPLPISSNARKT